MKPIRPNFRELNLASQTGAFLNRQSLVAKSKRFAPFTNGTDFSSFHGAQKWCEFAKLVIGGPKWNVRFLESIEPAGVPEMGARSCQQRYCSSKKRLELPFLAYSQSSGQFLKDTLPVSYRDLAGRIVPVHSPKPTRKSSRPAHARSVSVSPSSRK